MKSPYNKAFRSKQTVLFIAVLLALAVLLSACSIKSVVSEGVPEQKPTAAKEAEAAPDSIQDTTETVSDSTTVSAVVPEPTAEPEQTTEPEPTVEPERTAEPEATVEPESISNPEPAASESASFSEEVPEPDSAIPETPQVDGAVYVSNIDSFLAALGSDRTVVLTDGFYDLCDASDYGQEKNEGAYTWEYCFDGFQLVIQDAENLEIRGSSKTAVTISAEPRYANVLAFRNCKDLCVVDLSAGHTKEPGFCAGGVLEFQDCERVTVDGCGLYGCGTVGVNSIQSREVLTENTEIYECTYGAVSAIRTFDFEVNNCRIHDCGRKDVGYHCFNLLESISTTGFAVVNCEIADNDADVFLYSDYSQESCLLGCEITGNRISDCVFNINGNSFVVDGCAFMENTITGYYRQNFSSYAVNSQGEDLITFDFERMERVAADYSGPEMIVIEEPEGQERTDGSAEFHVSTVDEFLAAIGPNRTVYLEAEEFDLSSASNYGGFGNGFYYWESAYDGPMLVIDHVTNFHLIGLGKGETTILAVPRYAAVLQFVGGENISISNLTAGHTDNGECSGDVFSFSNVTGLEIDGCGLFGCGAYGITSYSCGDIILSDCEIYSCTYGSITMDSTDNVTMTGLDIHDMPSLENAYFYNCRNVFCDGRAIGEGIINLVP